MFEQVVQALEALEAEWDPFADAVPPPAPPQDWEHPDFAARFEAIIAADPQRPRTADDVLAANATAPTPYATFDDLAQLRAADVTDDATRLKLAAVWDRQANYATARRAEFIAAVVAAETPNPVIEPRHITNSEVAATLGVGLGEADNLVDASHALLTRLPAMFAAALAGDVSWGKASYLAWKTSLLTEEQALAVEARVLPAAGKRTPALHAAAVRRAVDRVDPAGAANRRTQQQADIRLVCRYLGDGMGEIFAHLPVEQLDTIWTAAEVHARRAKAAGDTRDLDRLRVQAIFAWANNYLTGQPVEATTEPEPAASSVPTRHGRRAAVRLVWDLTSLLEITDHPAELADSGESLPPAAMREEVLPQIRRVRRLLIEPDHGELIDLTPRSWPLPTRTGDGPTAYLLDLVVETWQRHALTTGDITGLGVEQVATVHALQDALDTTDPDLREIITALLEFPETAESLDNHPDAERPSAALAEFVCVRDRHPTNPCAGPTPATAGDLDHTIPRAHGGTTTRDGLTPLTRRWHRLKTHGGWNVRRHGRGWQWTSPTGGKHYTYPHDYRLGP